MNTHKRGEDPSCWLCQLSEIEERAITKIICGDVN